MKVRKGWVSNSSSSSFICDICNSNESGWDLCLSDVDMAECSKCHSTFCLGHVDADMDEIKIAYAEDMIKYWTERGKQEDIDSWVETKEELENGLCTDNMYDIYYEFPSSLCPICNNKNILDSDVIKYVIKKHGYENISEIKDEIKDKFGTKKELEDFLK